MKGFWMKFWLTAGWLGFCPVAPGTFGTLGGVALALAAGHASDDPWIRTQLLLALVMLFSGATLWYGDQAEGAFGRKDPPEVVSDEVAGFLLSLLLLPEPREGLAWVPLGGAFLLFRLFDILKPPPIRSLQHLPGGWGILLDDLAAGLLANVCLQGLLRLPLRDLLAYRGL